LLIELMQTHGPVFDRVDAILEDDLLRDVLEALCGEPAMVRPAPMFDAGKDPAATKQKRRHLLALPAQIGRRRFTRPHQVANRLVDRSGTHTGVSSNQDRRRLPSQSQS
jgi:hypothetical protein